MDVLDLVLFWTLVVKEENHFKKKSYKTKLQNKCLSEASLQIVIVLLLLEILSNIENAIVVRFAFSVLK